jgi:hypothetical protein
VCTGMEPLGVTINFRQFLIGISWPARHRLFTLYIWRPTYVHVQNLQMNTRYGFDFMKHHHSTA